MIIFCSFDDVVSHKENSDRTETNWQFKNKNTNQLHIGKTSKI